jgi:hypothetical protein
MESWGMCSSFSSFFHSAWLFWDSYILSYSYVLREDVLVNDRLHANGSPVRWIASWHCSFLSLHKSTLWCLPNNSFLRTYPIINCIMNTWINYIDSLFHFICRVVIHCKDIPHFAYPFNYYYYYYYYCYFGGYWRLLCKHPNTWTTLPVILLLVCFSDEGSSFCPGLALGLQVCTTMPGSVHLLIDIWMNCFQFFSRTNKAALHISCKSLWTHAFIFPG